MVLSDQRFVRIFQPTEIIKLKDYLTILNNNLNV